MRNAVDTAPSLRNPERSLLEPDDVLELVEKALLDLLRFAADAAQLAQRLPLLLGQIGGNHDADKDQLVAPTSGPHVRDATTVDADRLSILGAGRYVDLLGPVHRWDFHRVTQGGLCHAQGQLIDDVGAVPLQHRVGRDLDDNVPVTGGTTTRTDVAFTAEPTLRATEVKTGHAVRAGVAKAVIALPLGLVAQDLVGLVDLLEAGLGLRIIRIAIGVKLEREFPVGALQLFGGGRPRNAEDLVVIPLDRHSLVLGL